MWYHGPGGDEGGGGGGDGGDEKKVCCLFYADDIVLLAETEEELHRQGRCIQREVTFRPVAEKYTSGGAQRVWCDLN